MTINVLMMVDHIDTSKGKYRMIEMLVCGLMAYYNVDCIQFYFYDGNNAYPWPHTIDKFVADSEKYGKLGIVNIYNTNQHLKDACGMTILSHELQRFHQNRWDYDFCNHSKHI